MKLRSILLYGSLIAIFAVSSFVVFTHFWGSARALASSYEVREIFHEIISVQEEETYLMDFDALRAYFGNNDITAHLYIPGTNIDYLVVQGRDNNFYLYHDIWRERSSAGWIFLDYEVDLSGRDQNMVIYGHNMNQDHMFHSLRRFRERDFFEQHREIILNTPYAVYRFETFSFFVTRVDFEYTLPNFPQAVWRENLNRFKSLSIHPADIELSVNDRVISLSTCTNVAADERFVLQGRLMSDN